MIYIITFGILIVSFLLSSYRQQLNGKDEKKDKILKWTIIGLLVLDLIIAIIC